MRHLGEIRALDHFETDRFIGGHPLRILQRVDESAARELAAKLSRLGAAVSVEPSPPEFAMPADISLMSLDGDEPAALGGAPEPKAAPEPEPQRAFVEPPADAFSAPPIAEKAMELEIPRPPRAVTPSAPPASPAPHPEPFDNDVEESSAELVPGRLFQGRLRQQPALRLAIGLVLGLILGYALSSPYQSRAERRVAAIRAQANADRYRPVEEARANAAHLDEQADDLASSAFTYTLLIWLGTAGAVVAVWHRLT